MKPRSRKTPGPEINVTPLVDVVLVLLIIFMVAAQESKQEGDLPELRFGEATDIESPLLLKLSDGGRLRLGDKILGDNELPAALKAAHEEDQERPLWLSAESKVAYRRVKDVYAVAQNAGFEGVFLLGQNASSHVEH